MDNDNKLIRFDWAIKRLLRHKADHSVLEGFLTSLLGRPIKILRMLESESNKEYEENKHNRVDMLAEEADGAKILIEVQNETEASYFHRMLFGTSRIIHEYIKSGDKYDRVTKVYSINIVYFNLGEGSDYVYHGKTEFRGLHNDEILRLPKHLKVKYDVEEISQLFPEYFILRVNDFDKWSKTPLDQWMYFLSKSHLPDDADAPGLKEAREQLRVTRLTPEQRDDYYSHLRDMNSFVNLLEDARYEGEFKGMEEGMQKGLQKGREEGLEEGLQKGREEGLEKGLQKGREEGLMEGKREIARNLLKAGMTLEEVSRITLLSQEEIKSIL